MTMNWHFIVAKAKMEMILIIDVSASNTLLLRRTCGYERFLKTVKVGNFCEMIVVLCMHVKYR